MILFTTKKVKCGERFHASRDSSAPVPVSQFFSTSTTPSLHRERDRTYIIPPFLDTGLPWCHDATWC